MSHDKSAIDLDGQEGDMMSGVFRWKRSHKLRSMPRLAAESMKFIRENEGLNVSQGWMEYLASRTAYDKTGKALGDLVSYVQQDLSMIDCLSFPLSILQGLNHSSVLPKRWESDKQMDVLHIVCIGCSSKAEERVLRETNCFMELALGLVGAATSGNPVHHLKGLELYVSFSLQHLPVLLYFCYFCVPLSLSLVCL